jgi:hypothetical protein
MRVSLTGVFVALLLSNQSLATRDVPDLGITIDNPNGRGGGKVVHLTLFSSKLTFHKEEDVWKGILGGNDGK